MSSASPTSGSLLGSSSALAGYASYLSDLAKDGNALVWELTDSSTPGDHRWGLGDVAGQSGRGARIPGARLAALATDALAALAAAPAPLLDAFAGIDRTRPELAELAQDARRALVDVVSSFAESDAHARESSGTLFVVVGHVDAGPARHAFAALTRLAGALVIAELATT